MGRYCSPTRTSNTALQSLRHEVSKDREFLRVHAQQRTVDLPPDLTLCLYRIVQEAPQNAIKYSRAREVSVELTCGLEGLALTIVDDGVGFDVKAVWGPDWRPGRHSTPISVQTAAV